MQSEPRSDNRSLDDEKNVAAVLGSGDDSNFDTESLEAQGEDITVLADAEPQRNAKTTKDGKILLIPRPSDDPEDPLNWSWTKKHMVFCSLIAPAFLTDFGMTYGAVAFAAQSATFKMTVPSVANSISGGIFMQGPGGLLAVPFTQRYGRLPVLFWSQVLACAMVIGASLSPNYAAFTTFRTLQGFFNTAPQVIGLTVIHDMFFFHERTRKINVWAFCFLVGPYVGPFMSSMILSKLNWRDDFSILASMYGCSLILVLLLADETLYDRATPAPKPKGFIGMIKLFSGIHGASVKAKDTLRNVFWDIVLVQIKPHIFLPLICFYMMIFMWTIGLVTTVPQFMTAPPYLFTPVQLGLFYFAPTIGAVIGELWGHVFNDWKCSQYIRTHGGKYRTEDRLWGCYPGLVLGVAGLVLFGQGLARGMHWAVLAVAWALYVVGHTSTTVAVTAYCLDSFPKHASIVAGIINMWRTTGGFCVGYFQLKWVARNGAGASFGTQAGILAATFLSIVTVQIWGKRWRVRWQPPKRTYEI